MLLKGKDWWVMSLRGRLQETMQRRRVTASELARMTGLSRSAISRYLSGDQIPNAERLALIAAKLHVTTDYLLGRDVEKTPNSVAERQVNGLLLEVGERLKDVLAVRDHNYGPIPLISCASAGSGEAFTDQGYPAGGAEEYLERPSGFQDPNAYAVRVEGDSMAPRLMPGDIVVASPNATFASGDICIVKNLKNDVFIKKLLERENHYLLQAFNPAFEPLSFPKSEVRFVHKVVWIKPK